MNITYEENGEVKTETEKVGTSLVGKGILSIEIASEDQSDPRWQQYFKNMILPRVDESVITYLS